MDIEQIKKRKGAVKTSLVLAEVIKLLNQGLIETVNLNENLMVDSLLLFENVSRETGFEADLPALRKELAGQKIMAVTRRLGEEILTGVRLGRITEQHYRNLCTHVSDIVRNWCAFSVGADDADTADKLERIKPFADDSHMGVREMAWICMRDDIGKDVERAVFLLAPWTAEESHLIRRFASEVTRPRGVWCRHISRLKENPELGLPLLEPLRADKEKYVQDSVANWLNDASKTRPEWVRELTDRWLAENPSKETERICKRALRSIS